MGSAASGLVCRQVGDELVVHDRLGKRLAFLNRTAADVWRLADEGNDPEAIADAICGAYDGAEKETVRAQIADCLEQLSGLGLLGRASGASLRGGSWDV
jgi:hypothetical protein